MEMSALDLIKLIAVLVLIGIIATPFLICLAMIVMAIVPDRDAPRFTWVAFFVFVSWHGGLALVAIFSPENREWATMWLFLTLPAIYTFGHVANLIFTLVKHGRVPRFGEWFD